MRHSIPSIRLLRAFDAVGRFESVSKAARAIHLSQPALTQAIAKLEEIVGAQLFERRATGTYLTATGVVLHSSTEHLLGSLEAALQSLRPDCSQANILILLGKVTNSQLDSLIAIVESANSNNAALRVGTGETSINRNVRELERIVGVDLVRRSAAGLTATEGGATFALRVALAFREMQTGLQLVSEQRQNSAIAIGAPILDHAGLLAAVVNELANLAPNASIRLFNEPFESLRLRLRSGSLDVIVGVLKPHSADLVSEVLLEDRYYVAARRSHPLHRKRSVSIAQLAAYDWIVPNRNAPRREVFEKLFSGSPKRPAANIETHSLATTTMTLVSSDRLALLTASELKYDGPWGRLVALPFSLNGAHSNIGITYLASGGRVPHHATLISLFQKHARALQEDVSPKLDLIRQVRP